MKQKILIADDSLTIRTKISHLLCGWGYETVSVADGTSAYDMLHSDASLSMAILDWQMPGLEGPELCKQIRESIRERYVYIIMFTAQSGLQHLTESLDSGADDFVQKSANHEELRARLLAGERLLRLHNELILSREERSHKSRLESIGQLAAGIAHEMNTPLQYLGDNLSFVANSITQLFNGLEPILELLQTNSANNEPLSIFTSILDEIDYKYLSQELPNALSESRQGVGKIGSIVDALRRLTDSGVQTFQIVDAPQIVKQAITLTESAWRYISRVVTRFEADLPRIKVLPAALQEALVHLIMNAVEAIKTKASDKLESIEIRVIDAGEYLKIEIADSGCGIPEALREKIFDPFFSTKEGCQGQGLALAQQIVVTQHRGKIFCEAAFGGGTVFTILLPKL